MAARTLCVAKCGWWWKYCDGGKGRLFKTRQSGVPAKWACDVGIPGRWCGKPVWEETERTDEFSSKLSRKIDFCWERVSFSVCAQTVCSKRNKDGNFFHYHSLGSRARIKCCIMYLPASPIHDGVVSWRSRMQLLENEQKRNQHHGRPQILSRTFFHLHPALCSNDKQTANDSRCEAGEERPRR